MTSDRGPPALDGNLRTDSQISRWRAGQRKVTNFARYNTSLQSRATDAVRLVSMKFLLKTLLAFGVGLATAALL